jgi:hypothetical protein
MKQASASKREVVRPSGGFGRKMREAPPKTLAQRANRDGGAWDRSPAGGGAGGARGQRPL